MSNCPNCVASTMGLCTLHEAIILRKGITDLVAFYRAQPASEAAGNLGVLLVELEELLRKGLKPNAWANAAEHPAIRPGSDDRSPTEGG